MRRGISLMEVLISIGIVAIGLISVLSLLPVAGYLAMKANAEERKFAAGVNSANSFKVQEFSRVPEPGSYPNLATATPEEIVKAKQLHPWVTAAGESFVSPVSGVWQQYCPPPILIDPMMVAKNGVASDSFPDTPIVGAPTMKRLTLKQACTWNATQFVHIQALADRLCMSADDVTATRPDDVSDEADSDYAYDSGGSRLSRQFAGEFSWAAMLAPIDKELYDMKSGTLCTLTILIFNRRVLDAGQEHMFKASIVGDTELAVTDDDDDAEEHLNLLRPDSWSLICRYEPSSSGKAIPAYQWFRAVGSPPAEQINASNPSEFSKGITSSADWKVPDPAWPAPSSLIWPASVPTAMQNYDSYVCIVPNLVAVYQRTMYLEGPSRW